MTCYKSILLIACIALSACQTTSIREMSSSEANTAKLINSKKNQQDSSNFPEPEANQLRMYVFTSKEASKDQHDPRDGYFIDFNVIRKPTGKQNTVE